jgi:hypothetical protein
MKKIITFLSILLAMSVLKSYGQSKPIGFFKVFKNFDMDFPTEIKSEKSTAILAEIRTSCTGEIISVAILEGDTSRFGRWLLESLKKLKKTDRQLNRQILFVHFIFSNENMINDEQKWRTDYYRISEKIKSLTEKNDRIFLGTVTLFSGLEKRSKY